MEKSLERLNEEIKDLYSDYDFEFDTIDVDNGRIRLETRENGDVGEEEYSEIDLDNAERICDQLKGDYIDGFEGYKVDCEIDTCDEWVHLEISLL